MKMRVEGSVRVRPWRRVIRDRGFVGRTQAGRPVCAMGFEPGLFVRPPLRLAWIMLRARIGPCRCPLVPPLHVKRLVEVGMALTTWVGRAIGLDVHRDFCVVAICEDGEVRTAGRVTSTPRGWGCGPTAWWSPFGWRWR